MKLSRRDALALALGGAAAAMLPARAMADAAADAIAAFTGGAATGTGGLTLTAPEIAENGNTVPIEVEAPGAVEIRVFATQNPLPGIVAVSFGPLAGARMLSTRCRLAGTQDVIAVAKMEDGSFAQATKNVKVTIGGCGG